MQVKIIVKDSTQDLLLGCFNLRFDFDTGSDATYGGGAGGAFTTTVGAVSVTLLTASAIVSSLAVFVQLAQTLATLSSTVSSSLMTLTTVASTDISALSTIANVTTLTAGAATGASSAANTNNNNKHKSGNNVTGVEGDEEDNKKQKQGENTSGVEDGRDSLPQKAPSPSTFGNPNFQNAVALESGSVPSSSASPSNFGSPQLGDPSTSGGEAAGTESPKDFGSPQIGSSNATPSQQLVNSKPGPDTFGGPQLGASNSTNVAAGSSSNPTDFGSPQLGPANSTAGGSTSTLPADFGSPQLGSANTTAANLSSTSTLDPFGSPQLGDANNTSLTTGNTKTPLLPQTNPNNTSLEPTVTTPGVVPGTSTVQPPSASPWFLDILHYFQFITLTGQLQLSYPAFFSTFSRVFGFSVGALASRSGSGFGGIFLWLVGLWTGVKESESTLFPPSITSEDGVVGITTQNSGAVISQSKIPLNSSQSFESQKPGYDLWTSQEDVGLSSFVIQSGIHPVNFFPLVLVLVGMMATLMVVVSVLVALGVEVWGILQERKKKNQEEEEWKRKENDGSEEQKVEEKLRSKKREVMMRFIVGKLTFTNFFFFHALTKHSIFFILTGLQSSQRRKSLDDRPISLNHRVSLLHLPLYHCPFCIFFIFISILHPSPLPHYYRLPYFPPHLHRAPHLLFLRPSHPHSTP
jgi:hypothetical protein